MSTNQTLPTSHDVTNAVAVAAASEEPQDTDFSHVSNYEIFYIFSNNDLFLIFFFFFFYFNRNRDKDNPMIMTQLQRVVFQVKEEKDRVKHII
jgi:hypothetical protein